MRNWTITFAVALGRRRRSQVSSPRRHRCAEWEASIFHAINDLPDWLYAPMWVFQLAGLLLVPLVVAVVAAVFRRWRLPWR